MKQLWTAVCLALTLPATVAAQERETFEQYRNRQRQTFSEYRENKHKEFEEYRRKRNEEFAEFLRAAWERMEARPVVPKPKDETVPPVVRNEKEPSPVRPVTPAPIPYDEVVPAPTPRPQPSPLDPIKEITTPVKPATRTFTFFGTAGEVRLEKSERLSLKAVNENAIADAWLTLSGAAYTNLVHDCLKIREEHSLCDWAYLQMLKSMAENICGKGTNEATLLMAYVYCQSGYKMRLAIGDSGLIMLFASDHNIYDWSYYNADGTALYPVDRHVKGSLRICKQKYPGEQSMSLLINDEQAFAMARTQSVTHQSNRNEDMRITMSSNQNLMDFFTSYPSSMVGGNFMTRWAMYANTPTSEATRQQIYPTLKSALGGCDQLTAVNKLLNFIQTGFVYEYDNKVWGGDRAFFPEESLFYPYCDCEDRSILLTRLVRDLLGLRCILIYYPGHLAAAVEFTTASPTGDYIDYAGHRFFITDATIMGYGAPVGETMRGMDNATAKVILLE